MIWTGGAIDTTFNQTRTTSQTDLTPTLLAQLGLDAVPLPLAKCLVCPGTRVGLFAFNNGIGYVNKDNAVVFDNAGRRVKEQKGNIPGPTVEVARRIQHAVVGIFGEVGGCGAFNYSLFTHFIGSNQKHTCFCRPNIVLWIFARGRRAQILFGENCHGGTLFVYILVLYSNGNNNWLFRRVVGI